MNFVSLLASLTMAHAAPPAVDFTGSWAIDEALSEPMEPVLKLQDIGWIARKAAAGFDAETEITQKEDRLVVRFDNLLGKHTQELFFDGTPHETVNPAGVPTTFTTNWSSDGRALVAVGTAHGEDGLTGKLSEHRTLSEDSQVMTVLVELTAADGKTASARRAYRRQ